MSFLTCLLLGVDLKMRQLVVDVRGTRSTAENSTKKVITEEKDEVSYQHTVKNKGTGDIKTVHQVGSRC